MTLEIVYTWPDTGRKEVRYRRPWPSESAYELLLEAIDRPLYYVRIVEGAA